MFSFLGEFARTGLCCQCEGESIAEPGGSASGPWPASAWFGMSCGSRESFARQRLVSLFRIEPIFAFFSLDASKTGWTAGKDPNREAGVKIEIRFFRDNGSLIKPAGRGLHTAIVLTLRIESGDDDDFRDVENDSRFCDPHPRA